MKILKSIWEVIKFLYYGLDLFIVALVLYLLMFHPIGDTLVKDTKETIITLIIVIWCIVSVYHSILNKKLDERDVENELILEMVRELQQDTPENQIVLRNELSKMQEMHYNTMKDINTELAELKSVLYNMSKEKV